MKRFTLLLLFVSFSTFLFAQLRNLELQKPPTAEVPNLAKLKYAQFNNQFKGGGDVFWEEQFDWGDSTSSLGWYLPDGWSLEDPGDIGYNWHWANDTLKGVYTNESPIKSTSGYNGFLALNLDGYNQDIANYTDYVAVNNSIISPYIDCSAHSSVLVRLEQNFRYWSAAKMEFWVTNDNGVHWALFDMKMGTIYSERVGGVGNGEKVDLYLNITDVAAGMPEVQFKITWSEARLYYWMIDDIAFMEGWDYDLQLQYIEADYDNGTDDPEGFFYAVPQTQISSYNLHGIVNNFGNMEQWGTHINATVTKNNEIIWNENSNFIVAYPDPDVVDTLRWEEQFTPADFGHYQFDFSLNSDEIDERPHDNFASMPFMVTDSLFSRCDEDAEVTFSTWGWYGYGHEGDIMGTYYTIIEDTEINSIATYISSADIACSFRMVLLGIDEETGDFYELLSSDYVDMDSTILQNHWVTVPLEKDGEGEFLLAGKSYVAAIELWNNMEYEEAYNSRRYHLGSDRDNFYPSGKSVFYFTNDDSWYSTGNDLIMVRMHLNDDSNIIDNVSEVALEDSWLEQNYPNPFSGNTIIAYKLAKGGKVDITVFDQTGRKVYAENLGEKLPGQHEFNLNSDKLEAGLYYYTLKSEGFTATKQMIVR